MSRDFNGTTDLITCGDTNLVDLSPLTICVWQHTDTSGEGNQGNYCRKQNSGGFGWTFRRYSGGDRALEFRVDYNTQDLVVRTNTFQVGHGAWYHVVLTWDGSATATNVHIYRSGTELTYLQQVSGTDGRVADSSTNFYIGNDNLAGETFDGRLHDLRVYEAELTTTEIAMIQRGLIVRPDVLRGWWPLFGGTSPEPDWSGNGNHGTLTGTAVGAYPPGLGYHWPGGYRSEFGTAAGGGESGNALSYTGQFQVLKVMW